MTITWFRHNHENRNDLLRFGLMRLHYQGKIRYLEKPFKDASRYGFSKAVIEYDDKRHLSFLLINKKNSSIKCIVDNEDSFALISPLLKEVDIYFCAGYNSDFFEHKKFVKTYTWQSECDIDWYRKTIESKIENLGDHFHKIKRFVPIAPNLAYSILLPFWKRKYRNVEHKISSVIGKGNSFSEDYKGFEIRYAHLMKMRLKPLKYDIVLNDSLWGWPTHRLNLHKQLRTLQNNGYKIHSVLKWTEPVIHDGSVHQKLVNVEFPLKTDPMHEHYELMLAQSRLGVFACGFHWGWRNIMMYALMVGLPVITDRFLTEAYFDMNEFHLFQREDHQWLEIEDLLKEISEDEWNAIKIKNQAIYDKYMSPEKVGNYLIDAVGI